MKKIFLISLVLLTILSVTGPAYADSNTIKSDTSVLVYDPLNAYAPITDSAWGTSVSAVPTWKHPSWPMITGSSAVWISNTEFIQGNVSGDTWRLFRKTVNLCTGAYDISGIIKVTSDNAEEVYVNQVLVGSDGEVTGTQNDNQEWGTVLPYPYTATGNTLTFDFIVRNYAGSSDPQSNPTGLIFDASINYSCPIEVEIDIKPGSDPSCFNNDGHGVIPVAILGSADFDVSNIDVSTVALEGLPVAVKGKTDIYQAAYEDVNFDGYMDLVVKFVDVDGIFPQGSGYATLTGNLTDGTPFFGVGDICITQ